MKEIMKLVALDHIISELEAIKNGEKSLEDSVKILAECFHNIIKLLSQKKKYKRNVNFYV